MLAIIGGSGLSSFEGLKILNHDDVKTPYGDPSDSIILGSIAGKEIIFLARHGSDHSIAPHNINYRANIWALNKLGVKSIISLASVGSIDPNLNVGDFVIPDQIIDYTSGRENTFFDGIVKPLQHIDFTLPFDKSLRELIISSVDKSVYGLCISGVYAVTQGPRLETLAEINRYENDGASIVGMTVMPEASLARELAISYAALCPVANHAAGRGESADGISSAMLGQNSNQTVKNIIKILKSIVENYGN